MPTDVRVWHHVILTTYGAWLHGDSRGFRTRHHRQHVEGDYKAPPAADEYKFEDNRSRRLLVQSPVMLSAEWRPVVGAALQEKFTRLGGWLLCLAISGQHVHALVKLPSGKARQWAGFAKKHTTFILKERGWQGKLWGVRSKAELIRDRTHQINTYRYILNHAKEGAWIGVWKTPTP